MLWLKLIGIFEVSTKPEVSVGLVGTVTGRCKNSISVGTRIGNLPFSGFLAFCVQSDEFAVSIYEP